MKQKMKIAVSIIAASIGALTANAITLDDIQFWTGSGTNRAALVIEWSSPEVLNSTTVPAPVADKTLVWGYRFNGTVSGQDMLTAIIAADPKLYAVADTSYGFFVTGLGYNLQGDDRIGITDGAKTNFVAPNGLLTSSTVSPDAARPINSGDLFWSGYSGPNWEAWYELGGNGGFQSSPNRGTNQYWTADDPSNPYSGSHGQWEFASSGLGPIIVTNGSWVGFSVAAGGDNWMDESDPGTVAYEQHKHAPVSPEGIAAAYVCDTNDFATEVISFNTLSSSSPYDDAASILGRPTLKFANLWGDTSAHRTKIVEAPYNKAPNGTKVIAQINSGGQVTVKLGRKIYDDPNNAYGVDLIVYGNSFFSAIGGGTVGDKTDLGVATLSSGIYGHPTTVSVSQNGVNWHTYNTSVLFPQNAYRWDDANHAWTEEQLNPTKPLNPSVYKMNFASQPVASGLDQFMGSAGGTGFDLKASGLPWIQYVRVEPGPGTYTVIDAIAAVTPTVVGDDLSITPDNITNGITNLVFQNPANPSQSLISINFTSVSDIAKISTISLNDLSSYAPVTGLLSSSYKITASPIAGVNAITLTSGLALRPGSSYSGNGADLLLFQWNGTNWDQPAFTYNTNTCMVQISQSTNLSAFVISQLPPVKPQIRLLPSGVQLSFTPVMDKQYTVERSTDLVQWTPLASITAASNDLVNVTDPAPPATDAFYRVRFGN